MTTLLPLLPLLELLTVLQPTPASHDSHPTNEGFVVFFGHTDWYNMWLSLNGNLQLQYCNVILKCWSLVVLVYHHSLHLNRERLIVKLGEIV